MLSSYWIAFVLLEVPIPLPQCWSLMTVMWTSSILYYYSSMKSSNNCFECMITSLAENHLKFLLYMSSSQVFAILCHHHSDLFWKSEWKLFYLRNCMWIKCYHVFKLFLYSSKQLRVFYLSINSYLYQSIKTSRN